jgi:hypothetical protein
MAQIGQIYADRSLPRDGSLGRAALPRTSKFLKIPRVAGPVTARGDMSPLGAICVDLQDLRNLRSLSPFCAGEPGQGAPSAFGLAADQGCAGAGAES